VRSNHSTKKHHGVRHLIRRFRAFDSKTGKELWVTKLDYSALSVPITYEGRNGKQYVAVTAAGGGGITDPNPANTESLYVFALP
jgi:quinoprotein glucose dehydrogenase